jgi:hypothetical protein
MVGGPVPEPAEGEAVVRTEYLSIDPTVRTWISEARSYFPPVAIGEPVRCPGAGHVVASACDAFAVGDPVYTLTGWQDYAVIRDDGFATRLPDDMSPPPPSAMQQRHHRLQACSTSADPRGRDGGGVGGGRPPPAHRLPAARAPGSSARLPPRQVPVVDGRRRLHRPPFPDYEQLRRLPPAGDLDNVGGAVLDAC